MTELPPDVRHRATTVVCTAMRNRQPGSLDLYNAVVDAVAEVLAAEPDHCPQCAYRRAQIKEPERYGVADDRDALQARVDLLTTALTGLVDAYDQCVWRGKNNWDAAWVNARAALSATPTEEKS